MAVDSLAGSCSDLVRASVSADDQPDPVEYTKMSSRSGAPAYSCHGALQQKNDLRLDTAALAIQGGGGASGRSRQEWGKPAHDAVIGAEGIKKMPGRGAAHRRQIAKLRPGSTREPKHPLKRYPRIRPDTGRISFPVRSPAYQSVQNVTWAQNPIDAFIAAEHEQERDCTQPLPQNPVCCGVYL